MTNFIPAEVDRYVYWIEERERIRRVKEEDKQQNLKTIKARLSGWQLESFEESYTYKIENGISLFKKSLKNE